MQLKSQRVPICIPRSYSSHCRSIFVAMSLEFGRRAEPTQRYTSTTTTTAVHRRPAPSFFCSLTNLFLSLVHAPGPWNKRMHTNWSLYNKCYYNFISRILVCCSYDFPVKLMQSALQNKSGEYFSYNFTLSLSRIHAWCLCCVPTLSARACRVNAYYALP